MERITPTPARIAATLLLALATGGTLAACGVADAANLPGAAASGSQASSPVPDAGASTPETIATADPTLAAADATPAATDAQAALLAAIDQTLGATSFSYYGYGQDQGPDETAERCVVILADSVQQTTADLSEENPFTFTDGKCSSNGLWIFDASQGGYYSPNTHEGPIVIYQVPADVAYQEQLAKTGLSALREGVAASTNVTATDGGFTATIPAGAFFATDTTEHMSAATSDQLPSVTTPVDVTFTVSPADALATAEVTIPTGAGLTSHYVSSWTDLGQSINFKPYFDSVGGVDLPAWVQANRANEASIHLEGPADSLAAADKAYTAWNEAHPMGD